jgi:predicted nucleic acid-binding protein
VPQVSRDSDDDYLFALASVTGSRAVVSGDLDLTDLEGPPIPVMTPARAVEALLGGGLSARIFQRFKT